MAVAIGLALLAGPAFGDGGTQNQRTGDRTGLMLSPPLSPPVGVASIDWENASDFDVSANLSWGNTYLETELVRAGGHLRIDSIPANARNCYIWVAYPRGYNVWAKANGPLWCNKQSCTILVLPNTAMKVSFRPYADRFNPPPPLSRRRLPNPQRLRQPRLNLLPPRTRGRHHQELQVA